MFHTFFYEPIYNLLVVVLTFVPLHDIGTAIVVVTLIVKFFLLPLNLSALRTQYLMKRLEGEMNKIKELQKTKPQEASKMMIEMYRREKVNPFASLFTVILQIPIFFFFFFVPKLISAAHPIRWNEASVLFFASFNRLHRYPDVGLNLPNFARIGSKHLFAR